MSPTLAAGIPITSLSLFVLCGSEVSVRNPGSGQSRFSGLPGRLPGWLAQDTTDSCKYSDRTRSAKIVATYGRFDRSGPFCNELTRPDSVAFRARCTQSSDQAKVTLALFSDVDENRCGLSGRKITCEKLKDNPKARSAGIPAFLGSPRRRAVYKNAAVEPRIYGKTSSNCGTLHPLVWRLAPTLAYWGATRETRRRVLYHEFCEGCRSS